MNSVVKYGSKTNAQAGDVVVGSGNVTAGKYRVVVVTKASGTVAAGDLDNVQLTYPGGTVSTLMMSSTADTANTSPEIRVEFTTAGTIAVSAVANASGTAAVYRALLVATPDALYP